MHIFYKTGQLTVGIDKSKRSVTLDVIKTKYHTPKFLDTVLVLR